MADKQQIKRSIKQLQRVKTWQLGLLLILALLLSATFLRLNNIGMIERRTAVFNADEVGDEATTRARLFDLQRYAASHMNAGSGTIYLEDQYRRDTREAIQKASANDKPNNINVKADAICKAQFAGYSQAYVQCFASELAKFPAASDQPTKVALPNANLYRHEFSSPMWSADFAGFSVLVCLFISVLIVARLLSLALLQLLLRRHYHSI